jgi:ABC-type antimicrobial peptide transport system permease subunit
VALAVAQSLRALLYEVSPLDPAALAGAAILLLAAAAVSAYLPARAAARLDPLLALRHT